MTLWAFIGLLAMGGAGYALAGPYGALFAACLFLPGLIGKWGSY